MRLIVIGGTGFVGRHVIRHALEAGMSVIGTHYTSFPDNPDVEWVSVDIRNPAQVDDLIRRSGADGVVHAAAALSTTMDSLGAHQNWRVNAIAPVDVARAASRHGLRLVHISSDAIFSGRVDAYTESDFADPVYPYGAAKAAAELGIATIYPDAAIVRTSLIHGDGADRAMRDQHILDVAAGRADGFFLSDVVRCPVAVNDLAGACVELVRTEYAGVLNIAGPEAVTWHRLACLIAEEHGYPVEAVPAATRAERGVDRPGHVVLDCTRAADLLTTRLRGISEMVAGQPSNVAGVNL
jgi:dTDP-4-dehydrorhamnose reductase